MRKEQTSIEVLDVGEWSPTEAAAYVVEPWQNAVESIVETGRRLIEAKKRVPHGQWLDAIELMPFSQQTVSRLTLIAKHPDISNYAHGRNLPPSWRTLSILAQLPPGEIPRRIEAGEITGVRAVGVTESVQAPGVEAAGAYAARAE